MWLGEIQRNRQGGRHLDEIASGYRVQSLAKGLPFGNNDTLCPEIEKEGYGAGRVNTVPLTIELISLKA